MAHRFYCADKDRLILQKYSMPFINVSLADERIHKLQFSPEEENGKLLIAFDVALFLVNSSGRIECRFRTTQAQLFVDALRERVSG